MFSSSRGTNRLRYAVPAGVASLSLLLAACGGDSSGGEASGAPAAGALDKASGVTTVSFWHAMDGKNAEVLTKLVSDFNAAHQGKIEVKATYAGKYDDAITKYKAAIQSKSTPDVIQIYDIGTQFMIDAKQTVPMQSFIDRDKLNVGDLQPNITGYYSVDKKLNSMPFNTSMPVMYYNKTLFKKAGLDPEKPPTNLDEIRTAAEKLSKKKGGPADYGFGAAIYGWLLEQFIATSGSEYCDQGNGRDGKATKVQFDQGAAIDVVTWWQKMVKDGLAANTGRDTKAAQAAFKSGQLAINLESTGQLGGYSEAAKQGGWELGAANYPHVKAGETGGPIIGGASLWINGVGHKDANKEAAWQFVKFLSEPKSQATWHTGTGYFPNSKGALNEPVDVEYRKNNPLFDVAVKQLEGTELTKATQGCLLGVMPQARKASEDGIEAALNGGDPQQSMTKAAQGLEAQIKSYNDSVK
ncbi:carbohydrate ABC transporter substrate-binding protein, CUT1 family [Pedococcus cremeus]|uniref:Carbohydrate ABC transporter substrate-binding protein, CUT1 family n=1 Tax=Pedococcus cremeus TaxID=587636 RepID=A0A1H9WYW1_9MICO|nr:ABC transporter substrate-binding protein [Pedococcus cremeus]SES38847.1 carbohydrate ABC transporter substrate-binding protein, CUT1 family [Pedococcus cremeus]